MRKTYFSILFIIFLIGCQSDKQPNNNTSKVFKTTAPSLLYFKNIRSAYYINISKNENKYDLLRLKTLAISDGQPTIYPVIANHWLDDEAFLFIYATEAVLKNEGTLTVHWKTGQETGSITVQEDEEALEAATSITKRINEKANFFILGSDGQEVPILESNRQKTQFLTVYQDYLRLTENL